MEWEDEFHNSKDFCIRYFHSDPFGRQLYFIEIKEWGEFFPEYFLETSLKIDLNAYHRLKKIIKVLVNRKTSSATRKLFAKEFFKIMPYLIPEIDKYYFSLQQLDKNGKYNEAWNNTYQAVINNYNPNAYVPFSIFRNEIIFHELKKAYENVCTDLELSVEAEKELFEQNLINDDLKFAYTEVYENPAKYYFQESRHNDEFQEFYYMTSPEGKLLLWFLVRIN